MSSTLEKLPGTHGELVVHVWNVESPTFVVLLAHGYGEHAGRYAHVAEALNSSGGVVYAPDHLGHGLSEGGRAHIEFLEDMVSDLHSVSFVAADAHPGLPTVLIGHSMGGIIATRYVQRYEHPDVLVLSGPVIGGNPALTGLLDLDPIPEVPIDPEVLSRDPAVGEAYLADELVYHGGFRRETLQGFVDAVDAIASGGDLGETPTLWLHGELDGLAPLETTAAAMERIKGTRLTSKVYPGARHEIFNETNQDEVIGDVVDFVSGNL
jgi:alpha-beta hydrolase superfamily lysophospholipase